MEYYKVYLIFNRCSILDIIFMYQPFIVSKEKL